VRRHEEGAHAGYREQEGLQLADHALQLGDRHPGCARAVQDVREDGQYPAQLLLGHEVLLEHGVDPEAQQDELLRGGQAGLG